MARRRRIISVIFLFLVVLGYGAYSENTRQTQLDGLKDQGQAEVVPDKKSASFALDKLAVKGRAPKTGYAREQFSDGWGEIRGCDLRNLILARDLTAEKIDKEDGCIVLSGELSDPYTGKQVDFVRGQGSSSKVQIDHVVALSDAWQKGAQQLSAAKRYSFANDPLNLLAVDGPANMQKSDGDSATWLPSNKKYRCRYVARQIAVKLKYLLWVTAAEKSVMQRVLSVCPTQQLPKTES